MLMVFDLLIVFVQWDGSGSVWLTLISVTGSDHVVGHTGGFSQFIGFWPCWWFWTSRLFLTNNLDHVDGFWPYWWFLTSWLFSTNGSVLMRIFDNVDGFGPVDFFFDQWDGFWKVWSVLIGVMGSDHVVCHTGGFLSILTMLIVFHQVDGFRPVDCFRQTILTMLMVFDNVDGFGPVDCFRPKRWLLTSLICFVQCYGFRPCCSSYCWFDKFVKFWLLWCTLNM